MGLAQAHNYLIVLIEYIALCNYLLKSYWCLIYIYLQCISIMLELHYAKVTLTLTSVALPMCSCAKRCLVCTLYQCSLHWHLMDTAMYWKFICVICSYVQYPKSLLPKLNSLILLRLPLSACLTSRNLWMVYMGPSCLDKQTAGRQSPHVALRVYLTSYCDIWNSVQPQLMPIGCFQFLNLLLVPGFLKLLCLHVGFCMCVCPQGH